MKFRPVSYSALNETVLQALGRAGIPAALEPPGLDRGDGKRPDGITLIPFSQGKALCWDSTCTNTYSENSLNNSAIKPGAAATAAEESKRRKYRGLTDRFIFSPLGFETSGAFGPEAHRVITDIGRRLQRQSGEVRERLWLYQRLSLAVQRGNAATIIAAVTAAAPNLRPTLHSQRRVHS